MKKTTKWDGISYSSVEENEKQLLRSCLLDAFRELVEAANTQDIDVDCRRSAELMKDLSSELSKDIAGIATLGLSIALHNSPEQYDKLKFQLPFAYAELVNSDSLLSDLIKIDDEVRAKHNLPPQEANDDAGESALSDNSTPNEEKPDNTAHSSRFFRR